MSTGMMGHSGNWRERISLATLAPAQPETIREALRLGMLSNVPETEIRRSRRHASQRRTPEQREARLAALAEDFAALRNDREEWRQEVEERRLWDRTTRDGTGVE